MGHISHFTSEATTVELGFALVISAERGMTFVTSLSDIHVYSSQPNLGTFYMCCPQNQLGLTHPGG